MTIFTLDRRPVLTRCATLSEICKHTASRRAWTWCTVSVVVHSHSTMSDELNGRPGLLTAQTYLILNAFACLVSSRVSLERLLRISLTINAMCVRDIWCRWMGEELWTAQVKLRSSPDAGRLTLITAFWIKCLPVVDFLALFAAMWRFFCPEQAVC